MISIIDYIQLKAFARQDGLLIGGLWIAMFGCFIASFKSPDMQLGFIAGVIATPIVVYLRAKHFRDKVLDGTISYRRSVAFIAFTMAYASLIIAAATFAYFYLFDKGQFVSALRDSVSMPEIQQALKNAGLGAKELEEQMAVVSQTRPIDFAFSMLSNGLVASFLTSIVLGLFCSRKKSTQQTD